MTLKNAKKKTSLKKKMIFYFLMIAVANIFVAGEFMYQIKSKAYRDHIVNELHVDQNKLNPEQYIFSVLDGLSQKFMVMVLILIVVSAVVLTLFVYQIASPLQYMINMAERMSDGDLSLRIEIKSNDEIALLGNLINDLSVNQQELIAQLERLTNELEHVTMQYKIIVNQFPDVQKYFAVETEELDSILNKFKCLRDQFVLYTIHGMVKNLDIK